MHHSQKVKRLLDFIKNYVPMCLKKTVKLSIKIKK